MNVADELPGLHTESGNPWREPVKRLLKQWSRHSNFVVTPVVPGDDWLSEIEVPESQSRAEPEDVIALNRSTLFSQAGSRRTRLIQLAAAGLIASALLASFLVRVNKHGPSTAPPTAVVGLSFQSPLAPSTATACAKGACTSNPATDEDLESLREFFGPTYVAVGDRIRDHHGVLRGVSASIRDGRGDNVQLRAIWSPSAPAHWTGTAGLDGTTMVTRTLLHIPQGMWLVESGAVSPHCDGVTAPLWGLAEIGADAAQLHI